MLIVAGVMLANALDLERWLTGSPWMVVVRDNICVALVLSAVFYLLRDPSYSCAWSVSAVCLACERIRDRMRLLAPIAAISAIGYIVSSGVSTGSECLVAGCFAAMAGLVED
jgi:hypothetical protein